jgi:hypothetical protein
VNDQCAARIEALSRLVTACELEQEGFDGAREGVAKAVTLGREALRLGGVDLWCPHCQVWHANDCGRREREALRRLHDWALAQQGDCMFSGDHPIAQAAAVLSSGAAPELADCATRCKCPSLERCARRAAGLDAYGVRACVPPKRDDITAMVDAAMVEMSNIHPPLRRSECERLIRAAYGVAGTRDQTFDQAHVDGGKQ